MAMMCPFSRGFCPGQAFAGQDDAASADRDAAPGGEFANRFLPVHARIIA